MANHERPWTSSRFLLWDQPNAYPKYDLIDREHNPGQVFDLGVDLDSYDGNVYLKPRHVIEMARSLGMATVEEVAKMREIIDDLRRQINKLPLEQERLKSGIDDLVASFYSGLSTIEPTSVGDNEESEPDDSEPIEPKRETGKLIGF